MDFLVLSLAYILVVAFFIYVFLFGQSDFHRDGIVGRIYVFLSDTLWEKLGKVMGRVFGEKSVVWCSKMWDYVANQPNPLTQIFYLSLILPGYIIFNLCAVPYFPDGLEGDTLVWRFRKFMVPAWTAVTLTSFLLASLSDPGVITAENIDEFKDEYPRDDVLYKEEKVCNTCGFVRPPRSKHCRKCNLCIAALDHHCPWVNNCIGERNMRWFILFLFCTAVFTGYGAYLGFIVSRNILREDGLFDPDAYVKVKDGSFIPVTWPIRIMYLMNVSKFLPALVLFGGVMSVFLFGFIFYQLWHIGRGMTTTETFKWDDIRKEDKGAVNIYDRGVFRNLMDMAFPPSLYRKSKKQKTN